LLQAHQTWRPLSLRSKGFRGWANVNAGSIPFNGEALVGGTMYKHVYQVLIALTPFAGLMVPATQAQGEFKIPRSP